MSINERMYQVLLKTTCYLACYSTSGGSRKEVLLHLEKMDKSECSPVGLNWWRIGGHRLSVQEVGWDEDLTRFEVSLYGLTRDGHQNYHCYHDDPAEGLAQLKLVVQSDIDAMGFTVVKAEEDGGEMPF